MSPHFIYNIMASIHYLIETDPAQAQNALGTFSEYQRNILTVLEEKEPIPFAQELRMVQSFVALEKMRFGDRFRVDYDIDIEDFKLPALTVLALMENAIKHGLLASENPATVHLQIRRLGDGKVQIDIIDEGVGFDTNSLKHMENPLHSLHCVEARLREAGGKMTIESTPGEGTHVTVTLPPD